MKGNQLLTLSVPEEYTGQRIQRFLVDTLNEKYSGKEVKRAIEHNALEVNGVKERYASRRLIESDKIVFDLAALSIESSSIDFHFETQRVLYEDESILIYNKPAGITSVEEGLLSLLKKYDPALENVHRLDKDTTGSIIFSKTPEAKEKLMEQFRNRLVHKRYLTIVDGVIEEESGLIDKPIGRLYNKEGQTLWGVKATQKGGQKAITKWTVIKRGKRASLVECDLITGRTHQIRIHMSEMGYPIIGDIRYGLSLRESCYQPKHQLLHARNLSFNHPLREEPLNIVAPLPNEFLLGAERLVGKLEIE